MKAEVKVYARDIVSDQFGWVNITLFPETEKDRGLLAIIAANHGRLIEEDSGGPESVAEILSVVTDPEEIELEIGFPKKLA
ncbi:MAG: hypothetical protein Q7S82_03145 [bacterium]|nr:hypothetical protein [bacterium]